MAAYKDNTKWRCTFYYDSGGERKKKNKRGFPTKKEALEWEREFLLKNKGSEDMSFQSLYELYLEDCQTHLKIGTWKVYKNKAELWVLPFFKSFSINQIDKNLVRKWQNGLLKSSLKGSTIKVINSIAYNIFQFGIEYYNFSKNPIIKLKRMDYISKEKTILSEEQLNLILNQEMPEIIRCCIIILFWTGVRIGEFLALCLSDFNLESKTLRISKSVNYIYRTGVSSTKTKSSNRSIYINDKTIQAVNMLKKIIPNKNAIFLEFIGKESLYLKVKTLAKKVGIEEVGLHTFRHSHATYLFSKKVNILAISKRLGHANISTTLNTYTHFIEEMKDEIIEALS